MIKSKQHLIGIVKSLTLQLKQAKSILAKTYLSGRAKKAKKNKRK